MDTYLVSNVQKSQRDEMFLALVSQGNSACRRYAMFLRWYVGRKINIYSQIICRQAQVHYVFCGSVKYIAYLTARHNIGVVNFLEIFSA